MRSLKLTYNQRYAIKNKDNFLPTQKEYFFNTKIQFWKRLLA